MLRSLKFGSLLLIHFLIAVIGTAILDTSLRRLLLSPSHSFSATLWAECILSIVCALGLGFSLWRVWPSSAAKHAWVLAAAWFAIGLLATPSNVMGRLLPLASADSLGVKEIRSFFAFTVPLIRASCYSLGVYISSAARSAAGDETLVSGR